MSKERSEVTELVESNRWSELDAMSPAKTGALKETPSMFDDFHGTVVGIDQRTGEDEEDSRFYRQCIFQLQIDGTDTLVEERWNLPTDPKTGEPLTDNGGLVRPNKTSKAGRQEVLYDTIGVPWDGSIANIMGIHGHWVRKGIRRTRADIEKERADRQAALDRGERPVRRPREEFPYGRYLVSWDYYDNDVRRTAGLAPITFKGVPEDTAPTKGLSGEDLDTAIVSIVNGRTFLEALEEARNNHPELVRHFQGRGVVERLVAEGKLDRDAEKGKQTRYLAAK